MGYQGTGTSTDILTAQTAGNLCKFSAAPPATKINFVAYYDPNLGAVTGDGTVVSPVPYNSETIDPTFTYSNITNLFTAQNNGIYFFNANIVSTNAQLASNGYLVLNTPSGKIFGTNIGNLAGIVGGNNWLNFNVQAIVQLTIGQTVNVEFTCSGGTLSVGGWGTFVGFRGMFFAGFQIG